MKVAGDPRQHLRARAQVIHANICNKVGTLDALSWRLRGILGQLLAKGLKEGQLAAAAAAAAAGTAASAR